jgi:hypothetical protein
MINAGDIVLNEPTPALRVLAVWLFDLDGVAIPDDFPWVAGQVRISKAGAAFVNTANLPVVVPDGADGSFNLQLGLAEVNTVGKYRVQFIVGGDLLEEVVFNVRATASLDVAAVVAGIFAHKPDPDAPEGFATFQEQWNGRVAYDCSDGTGMDGPNWAIKSLDGTKNRLAGTYQSGKRTVTTRDGT